MPVFSNEEYARMHLVCGEMQCNSRATVRRYAEKYSDRMQIDQYLRPSIKY